MLLISVAKKFLCLPFVTETIRTSRKMQTQTGYVLSLDNIPFAISASIFSATRDLDRYAMENFAPTATSGASKILTFNYDLSTIKAPPADQPLEVQVLRYGDERNNTIEVITLKYTYGWFSSDATCVISKTKLLSIKQVPLNMYSTPAILVTPSSCSPALNTSNDADSNNSTISSGVRKFRKPVHEAGTTPRENMIAELNALFEINQQ